MSSLSRNFHNIALAIVLTAIVTFWLCYPLMMRRYFPNAYKDLTPGTYGDMYGSLNTLFSGLAFSLLIYTALLQRSELKTTRSLFTKQNAFQEKHLKLLEEESKRRLQLEDISHSPKLMLRNFTWAGNAVSISLINGGAPIWDLSVTDWVPRSARSCGIVPDTIIDRSSPAKIEYHFDKLPNDLTGNYSVVLAYKDVLHSQQTVRLSVNHTRDGGNSPPTTTR